MPIRLHGSALARTIAGDPLMPRLAATVARGLAALLLLAGSSLTLACAQVTAIPPGPAIPISAHPPAPPLVSELPAVPQPPPPPRVILEAEQLSLDEALTFDTDGKLASEHQDILAELAAWLAEHDEVLELTVEVHSIGQGSRRTHSKRSQALARQIVDALVERGVEPERLVAGAVGASADQQHHVALRVSNRAEPAAVVED